MTLPVFCRFGVGVGAGVGVFFIFRTTSRICPLFQIYLIEAWGHHPLIMENGISRNLILEINAARKSSKSEGPEEIIQTLPLKVSQLHYFLGKSVNHCYIMSIINFISLNS